MIAIIFFLLNIEFSSAFIIDPLNLGQPHIQCTVVKVYSKKSIFGFKGFPKLYDGIFNDPLDSYMIIAKKKVFDVYPKTITKTAKSEKIYIFRGKRKLVLELKGEPMSRSGTLTFSKKKLTDVTCH